MGQPVQTKQRTTVTIDADILAAARRLDLNVSSISEAAVQQAVKAAEAQRWVEENADILAERRSWIGANGAPLADLQVLKLD